MALHEKNMSDQWTQQMKRQAAAHTHHLNDQLAAQHDNLSAKHQMELQLQVRRDDRRGSAASKPTAC